VRFTASDVPRHMHACHCSICRRISGSAAMCVNVPAAGMAVTGEVRTYASSDWASRSFCGICGTPLWYRLNREGADYSLAAGVLDDLTGLVLDQEIYVDTKPAGYAFAGDHPRLTEAEFMATLGLPEGPA
jgi:hypothetical protein